MSDRDCENCKHHTEKGCDSWNCEYEQRMKRKEALEWLYRLKSEIYVYMPKVWLFPMNDALDMAIKALERDEKYAELRKRVQEFMMKENMFSINSRDFDDNFFDTAESEDKE